MTNADWRNGELARLRAFNARLQALLDRVLALKGKP